MNIWGIILGYHWEFYLIVCFYIVLYFIDDYLKFIMGLIRLFTGFEMERLNLVIFVFILFEFDEMLVSK
jgi:hypothetical protein